MLLLTNNATQAIGALTDRPELPETAGLRITAEPGASDPLVVTTAPQPESADSVIEEQGVRVFLDPNAATILDDKILDAHVTSQGGVEFLLVSQDASPPA